MADVFISYSRQDKDFVLRLHEGLIAAKREVWIDWEGILPTAEWLKEIYRGIDSADAVIVVLSPSFIASDICNREVEYAIQCKKRLIPIVWLDIDSQQVHAHLQELNWIFLRQEDDFDQAFKVLLDTLDMDLDYIQTSTKFLVRAREWERRQSHASFVLHSRELDEAEHWLAEGANKKPGPTMLHTQFITASRRTANRRQRRTILFLSSISFVLLLLTVISGLLFQIAQINRKKAEEQTSIAIEQKNIAIMRQGHLLASQVDTLLSSNEPDLALLVGIEGVKTYADNETRAHLLKALNFSPHIRKVLKGHSTLNDAHNVHGLAEGVSGLVYSPDGQTLISSGAGDGSIIRWDSAKNWERHIVALSPFQHDYGIGGLAMSPDGKMLASMGVDGQYLWDTRTGEQITELERYTHNLIDKVFFGINGLWTNSPLPIAFSPNGKFLVASRCASNPCLQGKLFIWDVATRKVLNGFPLLHHGPIMNIAFSPDGKVLALSSCAQFSSADENLCLLGQVELWSVATWKPLGPPLVGHTGTVMSLAFSPDGKQLATGGSDNAIILWNVATRHREGVPLTGHSGPITRLAFSPNGQILASASQDKTIILWNTATRQPLNAAPLIGHASEILSLAFSPDGTQIASGDANNTIIIWNVNNDTPTSHSLMYGSRGGVDSLAFSQDRNLLAVGRGDGKITLLHANTHTVITTLITYPGSSCTISLPGEADSSGCFIESLAFSPDGKMLASGTLDGRVLLWDMATKRAEAVPLSYPGGVRSLTFSPDGKTLVVAGDNKEILLWDMHTQHVIAHLSGYSGDIYSVAFSPNGKFIAAASLDTSANSKLLLWKIANSTLIDTRRLSDGGSGVAFSPDGHMLASTSVDGKLNLWDITTGKLRALGQPLIVSDQGFYTHITFSPDGNLIAVASENHTVALWDVKKLQLFLPVFQDPQQVNTVVFSPDGTQLVSGDFEGIVIFWNIDRTSWQDLACNIAHRNFTLDELAVYAPDLNDNKICMHLPVDSTVIQKKLDEAQASVRAHQHRAASTAYTQAVKWAIETDDASLNNKICWEGSVDGFAHEVLPACDRAVALVPGFGNFIDSQGLARGISGDFAGAIANFQTFLGWMRHHPFYIDTNYSQEREIWIQEMQAGHNPFNAQTLNEIKNE